MGDNRSPDQILCRYYLLGTCKKGKSCKFSHNSRLHSPASICKFYQSGDCKYGDDCMYSHVKIKKPRSTSDQRALQLCSLSSGNLPPGVSEPSKLNLERLCRECDTSPVTYFIDDEMNDITKAIQQSAKDGHRCNQALAVMFVNCKNCGLDIQTDRSKQEFLSHVAQCKQKPKEGLVVQRLLDSFDRECAICLEPVIPKEKLVHKSFGLLENCNHVFCLHCIRDWRDNTSEFGGFVRCCPICRISSHLVVPSYYFPSDAEEKKKIILEYKSALGQTPCRYFNNGKARCPFSTSCYYKHELPDGRLVDRRRLVANEDGELEVYNPYREDESLVNFFEDLNLTLGVEDEYD